MSATFTPPRIAATILAAIAIIAAVFFFSTKSDNRNAFQRIGDAVHELPEGGDQAADQLKDRSPAQKVGDAIEDAGENMKRSAE